MPALDVLLRDLALPTAYPDSDWGDVPPNARQVEVVQTHISAVFLTARSAYKVKKPVRLWGLVDYGTLEARRHWCDEEVRLNRRLAPDVYRGVVPIVEGPGGLSVGGAGGVGDAVEWAVAMRRFRPEDTLEARVLAGTAAEGDLERLGRLLGRFHRACVLPAAGAPQGGARVRAATFAGVLAQNVRATRAFVPSLFPAGVHADLECRLAREVRRRRALIRGRLAAGKAVDGHGDIRLEHVLLEDGRFSVVDCVEFTTVWRHIDPLADIAFLLMDLDSHGARRLARPFVRGYLMATGELDTELVGLFTAYRAHVRAKVDATTSMEPEVPAEQRARKATSARQHLALAWSYLRHPRPPLVVLRGPSGTGKSVLASALAPWLLAEVIQSDVVRKELFGLAPRSRPTAAQVAELYSSEMSVRTYDEMLRRVLRAPREGGPQSAILDATYLRRDARQKVYDAAARAGVPCVVVDVTAPPDVVRARLLERARRDDDPSDADVAVYEEQLRTEEPLTEDERARVVEHPAGTDPSVTLLAVVDRVATLDAGGGRGGSTGAP